MKITKERPPFAAMANDKDNYSVNSKQFMGVRNDLNRLINLQVQSSRLIAELINLNRKIADQLAKCNRGIS